MIYKDYYIEVMPDYRKMIENKEEIEELFCAVYEKNDLNHENMLGEFNMMPCFEYRENTVESIEKGIKEMIDREAAYFELAVKQKKFERMETLFYRAMACLRETVGEDAVKETFAKLLGMEEQEITHVILELDAGQDQEEGMNLC